MGISHDYERTELFNAILRYLMTPDRFLLRCSGADLDFSALRDHLETPSLLGGEPIALIDEAEKIAKSSIASFQSLLQHSDFGYVIIGSRAKSPLAEIAEQEGVVLDLLGEKPWEREKRIQQQLGALVKNSGKTISSEALSELMDRHDVDPGLLAREIEKVMSYVGERNHISLADVTAICSSNKAFAIWQTAEQIVWEKGGIPNEEFFHPLLPAIRAQLQLGLKIASLIACNASREEWSEALPKVYPKTLEKRTADVQRLGARYFIRGLEALFEVELSSRTGSSRYGALLDLFRCKLYAR